MVQALGVSNFTDKKWDQWLFFLIVDPVLPGIWSTCFTQDSKRHGIVSSAFKKYWIKVIGGSMINNTSISRKVDDISQTMLKDRIVKQNDKVNQRPKIILFLLTSIVYCLQVLWQYQKQNKQQFLLLKCQKESHWCGMN